LKLVCRRGLGVRGVAAEGIGGLTFTCNGLVGIRVDLEIDSIRGPDQLCQTLFDVNVQHSAASVEQNDGRKSRASGRVAHRLRWEGFARDRMEQIP
jgi:hypothetical protein